MSLGAWIPMRTFSPVTDRTETSMSSPIMMLWLDLRVRTSMTMPSRRIPCGRLACQPLQHVVGCDANAPAHRSGRTPRVAGGRLRGVSTRLRPPMARRSLRPHLNQVRAWVRQGRTDAWIAHQLEVTVQEIQAFKRDNELLPDGEGGGEAP